MTIREIIQKLVDEPRGTTIEFDLVEELRKEWAQHHERVKRVEDNLTDTTWLVPEAIRDVKKRKIAVRFNTEHAGTGYNWRVFVYEEDGTSKQIIAKEVAVETAMYTETFLNDKKELKGNIFCHGYVRADLQSVLDANGLPDKADFIEIFGDKGPLVHEEDLKGWVDDADFKKDEIQDKLDLAYHRASTGQFFRPEDPR